MAATPNVGRIAVIQMNAVTIGYATGFSSDLTQTLIKEYALGSNKPSILAAGNQTYKISCDKMYVSSTYATQVYGGTAVDFIIAPQGTTTGKVKVTIKNVVLDTHNTKVDQKGVVSEKITGEGTDYVIGTY